MYEGGMLKSVCFKDVGADDACGCVKVFKSVGVLECLWEWICEDIREIYRKGSEWLC